MGQMNLYKLTDIQNREFWVVSTDPTAAEEQLRTCYDAQVEKQFHYREPKPKIKTIELITEEMYIDDFTGRIKDHTNRLVIPGTCDISPLKTTDNDSAH